MSCFRPGVAVLALLAAGVTASVVAAEPASPIDWRKDLRTAHRQAAATGKPVLIVFDAEWCRFCKKYEAETLGDPTMAAYLNREFIPVRLDFDRDRKVADVLEVESLPCTVILSPEADLLGKVVGAQPPKDLWEALQDSKELQAKVRQARFAKAAR